MILIADDLGSKEFIKLFPKGTAKLVPHKHMPYGDFAWTGKGPGEKTVWVGVEFKVLADVLNCIDDGRFAGTQLPGMIETYDYPFLLVEGMWRSRQTDGALMVPRKKTEDRWIPAPGRIRRPYTYIGTSMWLTSMALRGGITLLPPSPRRTDTVRLLTGLYKWWQKPWKGHRAHLAEDRSKRPIYRPTICQSIAACLPGIGWTKAAIISDHFKNDVSKMIRASEEEWIIPKAVGKPTAKRFRRLFNEGKS